MESSVNCVRRVSFAGSLVLLIAAVSTHLFSQASNPPVQPTTIRIGIPVMRNTSTRSVDRRLMRDWLVRSFEPSKKNNKKSPLLEAVALESESATDIANEARSKNCDYILSTNLLELREPGDPSGSNQRPGTVSIGRDPLSAYPDPSVMHDPVNYAVLEYRLQALGEPAPRLDLTVSGQEHADENATVQRLLFQIVDRVKAELRKPASVTPE